MPTMAQLARSRPISMAGRGARPTGRGRYMSVYIGRRVLGTSTVLQLLYREGIYYGTRPAGQPCAGKTHFVMLRYLQTPPPSSIRPWCPGRASGPSDAEPKEQYCG